MSAAPNNRLRIVDAVFAPTREVKTLRVVVFAILCAVALHAVFVLVARLPDNSLEVWSEEVSQYVHEHVVVVERVRYTPPPPPPPVEESVPYSAVPSRARAVSATPPQAPPSDTVASGPAVFDFGDTAIENMAGATGFASGHAGTGTSSSSTSGAPAVASTPPDDARAGTPVGLVDDDWNCPWPEDADDAAIDSQTTVVRVVVRADGRAESARAISGSEHGFGAAAVSCAMNHEYTPARDAAGVAIRRESSPIRIRFIRSAQ